MVNLFFHIVFVNVILTNVRTSVQSNTFRCGFTANRKRHTFMNNNIGKAIIGLVS